MKQYYNKIKKESNILCTIKQSTANWLGHILHSNCLLKHKIKGTRRLRRRCKQLLDNLKKGEDIELERRSTKLHSQRICSEKGYGPVKTNYMVAVKDNYISILFL
jgi:hypothetical protein